MAYKALDIANKLLLMSEASECGELLTNMKLQKMLYYQQGFHLAYFGTPLLDEDLEAWMYGPVCPVVYYAYKNSGKNGICGNPDNDIAFDDPKEETLFNEVISVYGKYSATGLMQMTHEESPWRSTPVGEGNVIDKLKMQQFFKSRLA